MFTLIPIKLRFKYNYFFIYQFFLIVNFILTWLERQRHVFNYIILLERLHRFGLCA